MSKIKGGDENKDIEILIDGTGGCGTSWRESRACNNIISNQDNIDEDVMPSGGCYEPVRQSRACHG